MVTALISLLTDTPVMENLGMTGELTLTGRILAILSDEVGNEGAEGVY